MIKHLTNFGLAVNSTIASPNVNKKLPPASLQSFLIDAKAKSRNLPAMVITDHKDEFTNK
jgi:hypothetical protein